MAANIQTFASLRVPAWHNLGNILEAPVSAMEFQAAAGVNWNVYDSPIYTKTRIEIIDRAPIQINGRTIRNRGRVIRRPGQAISNHKAIVREDNHETLGIVGADYETIQNSEMFQFLKNLAEFDLDFTVETAGALGNGETVFALARMEGLRTCLGNDIIDPYILLCNGHIGNRKMIVLPTSIRVVCQNTLRMAIAASKGGAHGLSQGWAIRHTTNAHERLAEAQKTLQNVAIEWTASQEIIVKMAEKKADDDLILALIEETFGKTKKGLTGRGATLIENRNKAIFQNLESPTSKGLDTEGSVWSAMNAITEWIDHESIIRSENKNEARFENNLIDGPSVKYKEKAWNAALDLVMA